MGGWVVMRETSAHHAFEQEHHHPAVEAGVLLGPEEIVAVGGEGGRAGQEDRQVAVLEAWLWLRPAGHLDVVLGSTAPMCRLPEWSISHTRSAPSRQTSMKWLPPPRLPA
jgi:hypothetical protein